jgi:thiol:disulfide interchange protein DsbD
VAASPARRLALAAALAALWAPSAPAAPERGHVRAELLAETESVRPGTPFDVALHLRMDDGWHTYWKFAGDSGLPTKLRWDLPAGFRAGEIRWPAPERIEAPPLTSLGYSGDVMLLVTLTPPADLPEGRVTLRARADWLECADICVPGSADLGLTLPARHAPPRPDLRLAGPFAAARARLPLADGAGWTFRAARRGDAWVLSAAAPEGIDGGLAGLYFFPSEAGLVDLSAPQIFRRAGRDHALTVPAAATEGAPPVRLRGVLVTPDGWRGPRSETALELDAPVEAPSAPPARRGLAAALGLAFLGGLLLNLMPCVLPVLALKVLGFAQQAGGDRREAARHGALFAAGVLVSFWALAGTMLALRAGGEKVGWGFQLQSPAVVAFLALLFFVLGLSLLGVFEIGLSLTRAGGWAPGGGRRGAFANGVLATVVATPCTAPFMGAALGAAVALPAAQAMAVFTSLGLGMAAPYLLFSLAPGWLRFAPKPGAWMTALQKVLGLVLLATTAWLAWVFARQTGAPAFARLAAALAAAALGAWAWGRFAAPHRPAGVRRAALAAAWTLWLGGWAWASTAAGRSEGKTSAGPSTSVDAPALERKRDEVAWERFEPGRVEEERAKGRIVFVDFTADWCLTCQVNERVALRSAAVRRRFREADVAAFKADWTQRDETITRALQDLERTGVPVYALYPPDGGDPELLPAILTPAAVLDGLERAISRRKTNR